MLFLLKIKARKPQFSNANSGKTSAGGCILTSADTTASTLEQKQLVVAEEGS